MTDSALAPLIQFVVQQRGALPTGARIWPDGRAERTAPTNTPPEPTARLDRDRADIVWAEAGQLPPEAMLRLRETITQSGFFDLPPQMLINYCKEDPGTAIWMVSLDGRLARVVVFDPRPKRSAALDTLSALLNDLLTLA